MIPMKSSLPLQDLSIRGGLKLDPKRECEPEGIVCVGRFVDSVLGGLGLHFLLQCRKFGCGFLLSLGTEGSSLPLVRMPGHVTVLLIRDSDFYLKCPMFFLKRQIIRLCRRRSFPWEKVTVCQTQMKKRQYKTPEHLLSLRGIQEVSAWEMFA